MTTWEIHFNDLSTHLVLAETSQNALGKVAEHLRDAVVRIVRHKKEANVQGDRTDYTRESRYLVRTDHPSDRKRFQPVVASSMAEAFAKIPVELRSYITEIKRLDRLPSKKTNRYQLRFVLSTGGVLSRFVEATSIQEALAEYKGQGDVVSVINLDR